jgi:hypothetical protein
MTPSMQTFRATPGRSSGRATRGAARRANERSPRAQPRRSVNFGDHKRHAPRVERLSHRARPRAAQRPPLSRNGCYREARARSVSHSRRAPRDAHNADTITRVQRAGTRRRRPTRHTAGGRLARRSVRA